MIPSLWDETTTHNYKHALLAAASIAVAALLIDIWVLQVGSTSTSTSHVAGEIFSSILGTIIGTTLIIISRSAEQRWLKVLGWGFLAAAVFELVHGVVSAPSIIEAMGDNGQLSDWTSLASRVVLAVFVMRAVLMLEKRADTARAVVLSRWAAAIAISLVAGSVLIATLHAFGDFTFVLETGLSILPGVVFLAAFVILQRRHSEDGYTFAALTVFLLTSGAADAAFMAHSTKPFDGYFAAHHLFKLLAYGIMLVGLLAESQRLHGFEVKARKELGRINESLNQSNLGLTSASNDLRALNRIGHIAGISHSVADQFDEIGDVVRSRIEADRLGIVIIDPAGATCTVEAIYGMQLTDRGVGSVVPLSGTHYGEVVFGRKTIIVDESNIAEVSEKTPRMKLDMDFGIRSWLTTPIIAHDDVVGVLLARSRKPRAYGQRDAQFVEQVASQLAGPLSHGRGRRRLKSA